MEANIAEGDNKTAGEQTVDDTELDSILTDALGDFNKPVLTPKESNKDILGGGEHDPLLLEHIWDETSMKEAMTYFENSIRSVFCSSNNEGAQSNEASGGSADNKGVNMKNSDHVDIDSLISDFRKMAKMTADTLKDDSAGIDTGPDMADGSDFFAQEFSKSLAEAAQKLSTSTIQNESTPSGDDEGDNVFHNMIKQTIKSLLENNNDLVGLTSKMNCSDELNNLLKDIETDDNLDKNLFKFMKICMDSIKVVAYPSIKDLCLKFPAYLEESKSKLSESELVNYEKQYEVMAKICHVFETDDVVVTTESEHENSEVKRDETERLYQRFLTILNIMKECQEYGDIPPELAENQTKLFEDVLKLFNTQKDNALCSIL